MRYRHRMPTIFSLSMLDVLCCALGAVILLMILNFWDARRKALAAERTQQELLQTQSALAGNNSELEQLQSKLRQSTHDLRHAEEELKKRQQEIQKLESEAARLSSRLAQGQRDLSEALKNLVSAQELRAGAEVDLAAARMSLNQQERLVAALQTKLTAAETRSSDAEARLMLLRDQVSDASAKAKQLDADVLQLRKKAEQADVMLAAAQKQSQTVQADLLKARKRAEEAEAKLTDTQKQGLTVEAELASLRKAVEDQRTTTGRLQQRLSDAEGRFAGVDLAGRRVVLLIDMSGSMGSVDTRTPAPHKWPEVGRTVVHILRSLPEVEKYQVILFAEETQFLLGRPGQWLDFDRQKSPDEVAKALARVQPKGDTNMYAAFEAAFRLRTQGLDTIYLFSDGLPNQGPGLPAQPPTDEAVQAALLGKHVRDAIRLQWNRAEPRVRIHAVGFFFESPSLGAFLWTLTRENGGSFVGMSRP